MMEFIRWPIFIKIVSQVVKRLKQIVTKNIVIKKIEIICRLKTIAVRHQSHQHETILQKIMSTKCFQTSQDF